MLVRRAAPLRDDAFVSDVVGMSIQLVKHYCRFENKRENGEAALVMLAEHVAKKNVQATS